MRLTTKGRYAVTAMLDLAIQQNVNQGAVSLSDIAKRQSISVSYLEQLFAKLRRANLVASIRGATGGYYLARPANEISIMDIIGAVDEHIDAMQCDGRGDCQDGALCLTHELWFGLSLHIENYLKQVSLAQLLLSKGTQAVASRQANSVNVNAVNGDINDSDDCCDKIAIQSL